MNSTNYRGILITFNSIDYDFEGSHLKEPIRGFASSIEKTKQIIDEHINYIQEYLYEESEASSFYNGSTDSKKTTGFKSEDY